MRYLIVMQPKIWNGVPNVLKINAKYTLEKKEFKYRDTNCAIKCITNYLKYIGIYLYNI